VILSFADAATEDIFHGKNTKTARTLAKAVWPVMRRKLDVLNAAHQLRDLSAPPSNRLEPLKGEQQGRYSIRVNEQYRATFRFTDGHAHDVRCEDYH
jgi:toxin HigB-1